MQMIQISPHQEGKNMNVERRIMDKQVVVLSDILLLEEILFPTGMTLTDRIDYANDTNTASPKGTMPRSVFWLGAVSAKNNGLPEAPIPLTRVEGSKTVDKGSDGFRTIVNQSSGLPMDTLLVDMDLLQIM